MMHAFVRYVVPAAGTTDQRLYVSVAFPLVVGVFLFAGALLVGFTSYITEDKDREWWARSGGILLATALNSFAPLAVSSIEAYSLPNAGTGGGEGAGANLPSVALKKLVGEVTSRDWSPLDRDRVLEQANLTFYAYGELLRNDSRVYAGPIFWEATNARAVMRAYRDFLPDAPEELGSFVGLKTVPSTDPSARR